MGSRAQHLVGRACEHAVGNCGTGMVPAFHCCPRGDGLQLRRHHRPRRQRVVTQHTVPDERAGQRARLDRQLHLLAELRGRRWAPCRARRRCSRGADSRDCTNEINHHEYHSRHGACASRTGRWSQRAITFADIAQDSSAGELARGCQPRTRQARRAQRIDANRHTRCDQQLRLAEGQRHDRAVASSARWAASSVRPTVAGGAAPPRTPADAWPGAASAATTVAGAADCRFSSETAQSPWGRSAPGRRRSQYRATAFVNESRWAGRPGQRHRLAGHRRGRKCVTRARSPAYPAAPARRRPAPTCPPPARSPATRPARRQATTSRRAGGAAISG